MFLLLVLWIYWGKFVTKKSYFENFHFSSGNFLILIYQSWKLTKINDFFRSKIFYLKFFDNFKAISRFLINFFTFSSNFHIPTISKLNSKSLKLNENTFFTLFSRNQNPHSRHIVHSRPLPLSLTHSHILFSIFFNLPFHFNVFFRAKIRKI